MADLAVHLVIVEAVDDVAASFLETLRPGDVVALVETCAQLEEGCYLLARIGGGDKRLRKVRGAGQAVQRDLDGDHVRVCGGLAQQLHERIHALVGIGEQHVFFLYLIDDALAAAQLSGPAGGEGLARQAFARDLVHHAGQGEGEAHVEGHRGGVDLVGLQLQPHEQELAHRGGELALALQAHRHQAGALLQDLLHVLAVVFFALVGGFRAVEVRVARDADDVGVLDRVHVEDALRIGLERVLEQDVLEALAGDLDKARSLFGQGHDADGHALGALVFQALALFLGGGALLFGHLGLLLRLFFEQAHDDVKRPVFQMGEGMARVDDLRREIGKGAGGQEVLNVGHLLGVEALVLEVLDARGSELVVDLVVDALYYRVELVATLVYGVELLAGGHVALGVYDGLFQQVQIRQASHAHHEELLQVAREDAHELQALQKGHGLVAALVQAAFVEGEPGELAVLHVGNSCQTALLGIVDGGRIGRFLVHWS